MALDTAPEAREIQARIIREMTTAQRLQLAVEMSESLRRVAEAGLRSRQPELSEEERSHVLLRLLYGFAPQP